MNVTAVAAGKTPASGELGAAEMSLLQPAPQRSHSTHGPAPTDASLRLQQLDEDVARDVRAAQARAAILQDEVNSLLTRVANACDTATAGTQDDRDAVLAKVKAIRQARGD
ncbi:hypothetical protein LSCM1_00360 [Leishmania martiniquensis]|uniref:Uncharacterized protein n=1 Tax=Leishmania martiniquensis TaxID=1580590 RepID=A0A836KAZ0_9TRYP|nr:hypothetical protein LSCM1_00360 [Leishmania martiniquensis]